MRLRAFVAAILLALAAPQAGAQTLDDTLGRAAILDAEYADPTTRYQHGVLGDAVEWGALVLWVDTCTGCALLRVEERRIILPPERVFEDTAPRVIEIGEMRLVMVVETHRDYGARLALYDMRGLHAATPWIGTPNRWLAPIGAADLDGDGRIEIAYIDRPHLAKRLRVWRYEGGALREVAAMDGLTNHRIGWDYIAGGIHDCGQGAEIVTANANWTRIMATRFAGGQLKARDVGPYRGPDSIAEAAACG